VKKEMLYEPKYALAGASYKRIIIRWRWEV